MGNNKKAKILVVDDDLELRNLLHQYLDKQGFSVDSVEDGKAMDAYLGKTSVDLIILDLMLPGEDGLSIAKRLNINEQIPIIMLSACGEDVDRIIGLEIGADDYLAKPFNPRELLARIRSVLRRHSPEKIKNDRKSAHELFSFGPFKLNTVSNTLKKNDIAISLTRGEFSLLKILVENTNRVLSRDALLEKLKGYGCAPFDRSVDVRIMRLRHKIEIDPAIPQYIQTVWGEGYMLVLPDLVD